MYSYCIYDFPYCFHFILLVRLCFPSDSISQLGLTRADLIRRPPLIRPMTPLQMLSQWKKPVPQMAFSQGFCSLIAHGGARSPTVEANSINKMRFALRDRFEMIAPRGEDRYVLFHRFFQVEKNAKEHGVGSLLGAWRAYLINWRLTGG